MLDLYEKFRKAWIDRVMFGSSTARQLAKARSTMKAQPDFDEERYYAALLAADAEYHKRLGLSES